MQPIYYGNCTSNHCFDIPMVLILSMVWQYLAFFCWIFTWTSSHVLGLMTNTMLAILYLQSHAVLLWCIQGASYVFYISILNIRLSCERYRKNMVRAWTKILWWMGIRSTFLMGEPFLLTLLWLNSLSRLHKAICIYTGAVVHPFWSWHFHHSVFYSFVCYVHYAVSKTYHLYQCRYNLCLVYKHVVDKPRGCMFVMPMQRL